MKMLICLCAAVLILSGCQAAKIDAPKPFAASTHNPTAHEILTGHSDADIFQWNGIVYTNASHIEWVQQEELSAGDQIGTIMKQYRDGLDFEDAMATKLPVGTEIYKPKGEGRLILIVKLNGGEVRYLGLIEG
ncbi:hypothetical protein PACILC2_40060 [Paenibacillus cisolokensis]|uniref:Lipoprotein n=1 Tax=Paenibacillus cisolokensis TaxID=1658519 RepID=A0ABQ4NB40_9BACL|nr:hypothetical protein [Paenibacillus cisolokensis]GIQ65438.1 hypothetical protein PACILC2_40060 [Paenibacillus cisolokensis]